MNAKKLLFISSSLLASFSVWARESNPATLSGIFVTGECLKEVVPDRASIVLTSELVDRSAAEASKKVNLGYSEFKKSVEALKLADMRLDTQEFTVSEEVDYPKGKRHSLGYRARLGLKVRTSDMSRMSDVIAIAAKQGIQNVGSLESYISQEKFKNEYEVCLGEALKNAHSKAENLAKIGGKSLGSLRLVSEEGNAGGSQSPPRTIMNYAMAKKSNAEEDAPGGAPAFEASARTIQVKIAAEYNW